MGSIFSKPKMPDTSAAMKKQTEAMEKQTEILDKQEQRLDAQEAAAARTASASARSRRRGRSAYRLLLSPARANAAKGITDKGANTQLGA
jgi:hypothetical protein